MISLFLIYNNLYTICLYDLYRKQSVHAPRFSQHRRALDAPRDFVWKIEVNEQQRSLKQHGTGQSVNMMMIVAVTENTEWK